MSNFHSTVSRRDFMKGLGLAGAGVGMASLVSPAFHDLDELVSAPESGWKRPWWVKSIDEPTVEIDWSQVKSYDARNKPKTAREVWAANKKEKIAQGMVDWIRAKTNPDWKYDGWIERGGYPGSTRELALEGATGFGSFYTNPTPSKFLGWGKDSKTLTPAQLGVPKWQGTPEENLQMMRVVTRLFGGVDVGVVPLDENCKKLFHSNVASFEDVDDPYETTTKKVIPISAASQYKSVLVWTNQQARDITNHTPNALGAASMGLAYANYFATRGRIQEFLRGLGYEGLDVGGFSFSNPFGVLSGHGENTRTSTIMTSPEHGNTLRAVDRIVTNLPLAPTGPIDGGIRRFCYTCKKCAELCPFSSLSMDTEPSWERPSDQYPGGFKAWVWDASSCPWCNACMTTCVFSKQNLSGIHDIVKGIVGTTSIFDGFFRDMDVAFGYTLKDPESWWEQDYQQQPVYGIDRAV